MSAPRIVTSVGVLVAAVSAASSYASSAFPILTASRIELPAVAVAPIDDGWLIAEPQVVTVAAAGQRGAVSSNRDEPNEVTPENPIPRRNRGASPAYPQVAGAQPEILVNTLVRIGRDGAVTNVFDRGCSVHHNGRVLDRFEKSDPPCSRFFDAAAAAIRQWRYDRPVRGPLQFSVVVTFRPGAEATVVQSPTDWASERERDLRTSEDMIRNLTEKLRELERAHRLTLELNSRHPDRLKVQEELARLNDHLVGLQRAVERTREGSSQISEAAARLAQAEAALRAARAAQEVAAARDAEAERAVRDARVRALAERGLLAQSEAQRILSQPPNDRPLVSPSGRAPIRVSDTPGVRPPSVTKRVNPEHPLVAMQARVSGTVVLEVLVDEQGRVADARVLKSIPLLDQAALDAARQWEFTPTVINGAAVPVLLTLEMNFTLK